MAIAGIKEIAMSEDDWSEGDYLNDIGVEAEVAWQEFKKIMFGDGWCDDNTTDKQTVVQQTNHKVDKGLPQHVQNLTLSDGIKALKEARVRELKHRRHPD